MYEVPDMGQGLCQALRLSGVLQGQDPRTYFRAQ